MDIEANSMEKHLRKGTTTVGIKCTDGIVMAADKRVTIGGMLVVHKRFDKIQKVTDYIALSMAGSVSDAQLITRLLGAELRLRKMRLGREPTMTEAANLLGSIVYQNIRRLTPFLSVTGFLIGGMDDEGYHLYEIGIDGSVIENDDYVTDGSGMFMALSVFDTLYKKDIKINDAVKLAVRAINAAMQRDTATGEGVDVFTITKSGVKKVLSKILNTELTA